MEHHILPAERELTDDRHCLRGTARFVRPLRPLDEFASRKAERTVEQLKADLKR